MSCYCDGNPDASLLVVGMAPGREELRHDLPFVGGSGKLLWGLLAKKAGISRADAYILNVIGEWPEGKQGQPTPEQLERWWDTFNENLQRSAARVVLLLGGDAFKRVAGTGGITEWRGYPMEPADMQPVERRQEVQTVYKSNGKGHKKGDPRTVRVKTQELVPLPPSVRWIIPTFHPAAILRSGFSTAPALAADLGRVGRALRGELQPARLTFTESVPTVFTHRGSGAVAVDIETRMDGLGNDSIERIGVANDRETWTAVWGDAARFGARAEMTGPGPFIAHNIGFDAPRLAREGCPIPEPWWDTMYAALTLEPDLLKGLNGVSSLYLDRKRWKHLSEAEPAYYNAQDASAELELYYVLRNQLIRTGQLELFEGTMMRALPVLVEMQEEGVLLDGKRRQPVVQDLEARRKALLDDWDAASGGVNPFSPKQLNAYLYGTLGLPEQLSKYGGATTDSAALREMLGLRAFQAHRKTIELLLGVRDVNKQLETYAKVGISYDGHVHPSWVPAGKDSEGFGKGLAGTGRITSRGPNFQNIPPWARSLYIPRPGCIFVEADWNQIEARIIAALANDQVLQRAIETGLHAKNMTILGTDQKILAKTFFYGWSYGMGKRTMRKQLLAQGFDLSEAECAARLAALEATYRDTTIWRRDVANTAATTYRLVNPFARRRHFFRGGGDTPAALDFLPQSTAADCMWSVVRPLADALRNCGGRLCGTIHDSILIECPVGDHVSSMAILRESMEREFPCVAPGFRVPVEVKVGANWGEMKPV